VANLPEIEKPMISDEEPDNRVVIVSHTYIHEHEDGRRDSLIINKIEGDEAPETIEDDGQTYRLARSREVSR
jgi:hypothetical protein